jgi:hypothetical protein
LKSKPTWLNTSGCSTASALLFWVVREPQPPGMNLIDKPSSTMVWRIADVRSVYDERGHTEHTPTYSPERLALMPVAFDRSRMLPERPPVGHRHRRWRVQVRIRLAVLGQMVPLLGSVIAMQETRRERMAATLFAGVAYWWIL